jgi:HPt (histidine-containing phosphotransfer) domain-containing protein
MELPPPAADDSPIDLEHLRRSTLGDSGLEREVLAMFSKQARNLAGRLAALPPEADALAHTLKGAARAIGAHRVADCSSEFEAAIRDGGNVTQSLAALEAVVAEACEAIEAMLSRS